MPQLQTKHFGVVEFREDSVIEFPEGLPAFENERRFVLLQQPATQPIIFLQSMQCPDLAFLTMPVQLIVPDYSLAASDEEMELLQLPPGQTSDIGSDILCLAILTVPDQAPATANLMAPIVINVQCTRGCQIIQTDSEYSCQHALPSGAAEESC